MERIVIQKLIPCGLSLFGGNTWTVSIAVPEALEGTILDFLVFPDRQLVWELNGVQILLPRMKLEEKTLRNIDGLYLDTVVDLPDNLQIFDLLAVGISKERDFSWKVKKICLQQISKHLSQGVHNIRAVMPGFMNVVLPGPTELLPGEVGVAKKSMMKILRNSLLVNEGFRELVLDRCPQYRETIEQKIREEDKKFNTKAILEDMAFALSGVAVFCTRYPISGADSHSLMTLRVFEKCKTEAVYLNLQTLVQEKYGDCDGDSINFYFTNIPEKNLAPEVRSFTWKLDRTYRLPSLDEVWDSRQTEDKDPLQIMKGFDQRSLYIGMLTYLYWLLAYCCCVKKIFHTITSAELLKELSREDIKLFMARNSHLTKAEKFNQIYTTYTVRVCQKWFTPLIEGVMNARKDENFETDTGRTLAEIVIDLLTGKENILSGVRYIPTRPDDSGFDEERLTISQHKQLVYALNQLSDGKGKVSLSNAVSDLGHALVSSRFKPDHIKKVLDTYYTPDFAFLDLVFDSITLVEGFEIPAGFFIEEPIEKVIESNEFWY